MDAEFAAFGPWVYEVTTPDEVPPLYRDHPLDLERTRIVLKVPRNIDRRDAKAGTDLYDHLLVAGPEDLTVLSRLDSGYATVTVPYRAVVAIEHSTSLLDGRLTLLSVTGSPRVDVRYNGTSKEVVDRLVGVIRELYLPPGRPTDRQPSGSANHPSLGDLDQDAALVGECHGLVRAEPGTFVLAAHPRRVVRPRAGSDAAGLVVRLTHALWHMTLQAAILCGDARELQVIHRRHWFARSRLPVHSVARTVVPIDRIDQVAVRDHDVYADVRVVLVHLGSTVLEIPVPRGSDAEAVLTDLHH